MRRLAATMAAVAAVAIAGCSSSSSSTSAPPASSSAPPASSSAPAAAGSALPAGTITVLAAASLTGTFTLIGKQFEDAHPGDKVKFSFGASSTLATQITERRAGGRVRLGGAREHGYGRQGERCV